MSIQQTDISPMDLLGIKLKDEFSEVTGGSFSPGHDLFTINLARGKRPVNLVVKELHSFLKSYIQRNGDRQTEYQFTIHEHGRLVHVLRFHSPDEGYHVEVMASGRLHRLFVDSGLGAIGDFTVFNEDFQKIGYLAMKSLEGSDKTDYGDGRPYPNFSDGSLWEGKGELVETYLNQIVGQISLQIDAAYRKGKVDIQEPTDVSYYAEVFGVSGEELKEAVGKIGTTLGALEDYFQSKTDVEV